MRRPLFWTGLTFLSSTAVFLHYPSGIFAVFCAIITLSGVFLSGVSTKKGAMLLFTCAICGVLYAFAYTSAVSNWLSPVISVKNQTMPFVLTITDQTRRGSYGQWNGRGTVHVNGVTRSFPVQLKGYTELETAPGQTLTGTARLNAAFEGQELPLQLITLHNVSDTSPHAFTQGRIQWQQALSSKAASLSKNPEISSVLSAVLTGDRTRLSSQTVSDFRKSGLSHLLVVSGLHLVLVSRIALLLLSRLMTQQRANLLSVLFCWMFAVVSGLGTSIIRAAVMLTLVHLAEASDRRSDTLTSLMASALLMGLVNPYILLNAAFLLSFGAVVGLATLEKPIHSLLKENFAHNNTMTSHLLQNLSVGIAAQAGAAPILIWIFGTFPVLGIAANLTAICLIEPIMLLGILALPLSLISPVLAAGIALPCNALISLLLLIARVFSRLPFAQLGFTESWQFFWLGASLLLSVVLFTKRVPKFAARLAIAGCTAAGLTAAVISATLSLGTADIILFKNSDCAAVCMGSRAVLIGSPQNSFQLYEIQNALDRSGIERLEVVVLNLDSQVNFQTAALMREYPDVALCAPATRSTVNFAQAAGIPLKKLENNARLFGCDFKSTNNETLITFSEAKLLKNGENYAIIGKYAALKPFSETVVRVRVKI